MVTVHKLLQLLEQNEQHFLKQLIKQNILKNINSMKPLKDA